MAIEGQQQEVVNLAARLQTEGQLAPTISDWPAREIAAMLLTTKSGASFLVEPQEEKPSLVTRLIDGQPLVENGAAREPVIIFRHEGTPDPRLQIGSCIDILGLSKTNPKLDPEARYRTTPLVEIRYI